MPIVENNTEENVEYQVNDDPPFDRCEERKTLYPKETAVFEQCKGELQTHCLVQENGEAKPFVKGLPNQATVTIKELSPRLKFEIQLPPEP